jgi:hypothetical protein
MGRPGPEQRDTWQHQSPPQEGGGFGAIGHVAAPEPSLVRRRGLPIIVWSHPVRSHHTVAMTRGGQQPLVVGGYTVAACRHATPTLPVTATLVRCVFPLPATAPLSCVCALGTREPSCTTEPAAYPQRAAGHMAALEPFRMGRPCTEPRDTWQHRSPPQEGGGFGATGPVTTPELSSVGRQGSKLWDM